MKLHKLMIGTFFVGLIAVSGYGQPKKAAKDAFFQLGPGTYTANVKAMTCGGCGEFIEKTLRAQPGIESANANNREKTVTFKVKNGTQVKMSDLQKALKASSDEMGMGADYTLKDLKKAS